MTEKLHRDSEPVSEMASLCALAIGQIASAEVRVEYNNLLLELMYKHVLTDKELRVVREMAQGLTNEEVGEKLQLSPTVIKNTTGVCMAKLAMTREQLVAKYSVPTEYAQNLNVSLFSQKEIDFALFLSKGYSYAKICRILMMHKRYASNFASGMMSKFYIDKKDRKKLHLIRDSKILLPSYRGRQN